MACCWTLLFQGGNADNMHVRCGMSHTDPTAALPCSFGCHRLRAIEAVAIPDQVVQDSLVDVVVITVLATHLPHTRTLALVGFSARL